MKKSLVLAMALAMGVTASAYAANPFSDVPAGHWAYDSIDKLAAAGVIDGMGDGTFQGDKTMTRYEMAQIVAKAMAKGANVDKLAAEFADELDALGVRVAKLEKKADNVKITGEFRAHYKNMKAAYNEDGASHESNLRSRLFLQGQVNEDWTYNAMIQNEQKLVKGDAGKNESGLEFKSAYVEGKIGGVNVIAGRQGYGFGEAMVMDDDTYSDALVLSYGSKINVEGVIAQWSDSDSQADGRKYLGAKLTYAPTDNFSLKAEYAKFKEINADNPQPDHKIFDVGLSYGFGDFTFDGLYIRGDEDGTDGGKNGYVLGLGYKGADAEEVGSWGLNVHYYNQGKQTYIAQAIDGTTEFKIDEDNTVKGFKGWSVGGDLTLAKNMVLTLAYYDTECKEHSNLKDHVMWTDLTFSF